MRVLVTRPAEDARETAAALAARGHEGVIAPLLEIRFGQGPELVLDHVQAVLATSSNGVRAFAKRASRRDLPLFAVGTQTALVAKNLGFTNTRSAGGDARALAAAIPAWARPTDGTLLHAASTETEGRFAADLGHRGYRIETVGLYQVVRAQRLPSAARERLLSGTLDAVLLFSPHSAETFVQCVAGEAFDEYCQPLIACCISEAAAMKAGALTFRHVRTARHPDQPSLLELLD